MKPVPQPPAPTTPRPNDRGKTSIEDAGRGNGKCTSPARLPWLHSAALNRDPQIRQDANSNNVSKASALCSKGLLPGTTGHCTNAYPTVHATQDQRVSEKTRTEEKANMRLAATASPAQHTDGSAEPYQPMAAPAEERVMDERIKAAIAAIAARALARTAAQATNPAQLSNQAQTDAADAAQRPSATAAGAQTLQRIEATIATRAPATAYPRERESTAQPTATDLTGTADLTGTVAKVGILATKLASGMLLAAARPETTSALQGTIATRQHPTVSAYATTVTHNLGPGHTTPSPYHYFPMCRPNLQC